MKIALLGYGRMGKAIEEIALNRGHEIVLRKTSSDSFAQLENADVAIDFSVPTSAFENISQCLQQGIPVISGTTGWVDRLPEIKDLCLEKGGAFIYGSNFSLGVNIFFELNIKLAEIMRRFPEYRVSMQEVHHTQKLDAPSGTAITLAKDIIAHSEYQGWTMETPDDHQIMIEALRVEHVPGTHSVTYGSAIDDIEIRHTAHNRQGFAVGAVLAAEWLKGKKGVYTMKDVLSL